MNQTGAVVCAFQNNPAKSFSAGRLGPCLAKHLAAGTLALGLCLFVVVANSQAQTNFYWAGSASANWADANQWFTTNGAGSFVTGFDWAGDPSNPNDAIPANDIAWFTNSGTFNVSMVSPVPGLFNLGSNVFDNASGTVMNVSINVGSGITFQPANNLGGGDGIVIAETAGATSVVSFTTSGGTINTGVSATTVYIGKNGVGTLLLTNTYWVANGGNITMGDGSNSVATLIVSGPNTLFDMGLTGGHLNVGGGASWGQTVILSNSATMRCPNFRLGCTSASGSSNNIMIVDSHAQLFLSGGHGVVGNREGNQAGTNAPSFNNTLVFKNGGFGDSSNHTFAIGWADNDVPTTPVPSTGNVVIVQGGCAFTNISTCNIRSNNSLYVYGGTFGGGFSNAVGAVLFNPFSGTTTNDGALSVWGTLVGQIINTTGSLMTVSNAAGPLTITHNLNCQTGSVLQIGLGTSYNSISVASNLHLSGTINFTDSGGFNTVGNHTYLLFTHNSTTNFIAGTTTNRIPYYADTNNLTIGTVPNPSATYTISLPDFNTVNLIVSGLTPALPFQITSITRSGGNVTINWNTKGSNGQTNFVQASAGSVNGSYPGSFVDIANVTIAGTTASFVDTGGATNKPARYYRVRSPQ